MKKTILALATAAISTVAFAQSATNVITTSASQSTWEKIRQNTSLSYYGEFSGRTFANKEGGTSDYFYNSISLGYKVGKGKVFINPRFESYTTTTDSSGEARGNMAMLNPRMGYSGVIYGTDKYSIFNSSRLEIGINEARTERNRLVKIKQYNAISFNLDSRNTLDLGVELNRWFYNGGNEEASTNAIGTYFEAIHKYAFTDKTALISIFEFDGGSETDRGMGEIVRQSDWTVLKVGPEFALANKVSLYTAAMFYLDNESRLVNEENVNVFLGLSASI